LSDLYDLVQGLTSRDVSSNPLLLRDFSRRLGWQPSDQLHLPKTRDTSTGHLVVESGLENSAVLTFLRGRKNVSQLVDEQKLRLLNLSYNTMVDWHVFIGGNEVAIINNRNPSTQPTSVEGFSPSNVSALEAERFLDVTSGAKFAAPLPNLEDAFLRTVSLWKENLSRELGPSIDNKAISALFNDLIIVRAVEDQLREDREEGSFRTMLESVSGGNYPVRIVEALFRYASDVGLSNPSAVLRSGSYEEAFNRLDTWTVKELIKDFYLVRSASKYEYNFSLISKTALSKLYEKYVSKLRVAHGPQLGLFGPEYEQVLEKGFGSVYTPQYIAKFFARFIRGQMPFRRFQQLNIADPACGSGIFLRTFLEMQCDLDAEQTTSETIHTAFSHVYGLDVEKTASDACRVSLLLLAIALNQSPELEVDVNAGDALDVLPGAKRGSVDVLVTNPPFVAIKDQPKGLQRKLADYMGGDASGAVDTYLPFLKMSLSMLKDGGYACFVLPHSFLLSKSAQRMRRKLAKATAILCLADLSSLEVFEGVSAYTVLLVFQKKGDKTLPAHIVNCVEFPGQALQYVVEDRPAKLTYFEVFRTDQKVFESSEWIIQHSSEAEIAEQMRKRGAPLSRFLRSAEGINTGADPIFIVDSRPEFDGGALFVRCVRDREIGKYEVPPQSGAHVFYPYDGERKITEDELRKKYPQTYNYLLRHKDRLAARRQVQSGNLLWWLPERPRTPDNMLRPKIITPHLVIAPRFAADLAGNVAVSRSPVLLPRESTDEAQMLLFMLGALNSSVCFWFISSFSHKYSRGYTMLEPKTLNATPVPDPSQVSYTARKKFVDLVNERLTASADEFDRIDQVIDAMMCDFFGLSDEQRSVLGILAPSDDRRIL